jgi:hypothetical protein
VKIWQIVGLTFVTYLSGFYTARAQNCPASATLRAPFEIGTVYTASGYMGDGTVKDKYVQMRPVSGEALPPGARGSVPYEITYQPGGGSGWAGILWQSPPNNWGDKPGQAVRGASKITFWARGERGNEIVKFEAGNNFDGKCRDSFAAGTDNIALTRVWRQYEIDLRGKDLSSVLDAFGWVATVAANPNGLTFYIDSIRYETGGSTAARKK